MPRPETPRRQIAGIDTIARALDEGEPVRVLLLRRDDVSEALQTLALQAQARDVKVYRVTDNDLRRMRAGVATEVGSNSATEGAESTSLALLGPDPLCSLDELIARPGATWLLHRPAYASNVGFTIRTAEVSGADGVIVDSDFSKSDRDQALRVSMGAHRFLPVHWDSAEAALTAAATAGKQILALEDVGDRAPWEVDLTKPSLLIVGNERHGLPETILERCHTILRIPMRGFVPSYNLQAAVAALSAERLRQLAEG